MPFRFVIEQIAIAPPDTAKARALLSALGADQWVADLVVARGNVKGAEATNVASLSFNYQLSRDDGKPMEFEVLNYEAGQNWISNEEPCVSHLGMHVLESDLPTIERIMNRYGVKVVQDVLTQSHSNPAIATSRRYHYVIYGTRRILGVDLKFIVRREFPAADSFGA